jgi:hypothetical protein
MPASLTPEEAIASIRRLISHPPVQGIAYGNGLHFAIHKPGQQSEQNAGEPGLTVRSAGIVRGNHSLSGERPPNGHEKHVGDWDDDEEE